MKQNQIIALFGLRLLFLVMAVLYSIIFLAPEGAPGLLRVFVPLVVFTGFFIFLIGAALVALSIFKRLGGFKK